MAGRNTFADTIGNHAPSRGVAVTGLLITGLLLGAQIIAILLPRGGWIVRDVRGGYCLVRMSQ